MACSGLHCAGCAGGAAVPVVPLAAVFGLAWVAEHIVEVVIASAVCGALAVAAVVALLRWSDRMDARRAARWSLMTARPDAPVITATATPQVTAPPVQVIEHHHFVHAITPDPVPAVIRAAIPGQAGDATTEGN